MQMNKIYAMIGMACRAGKVVSGEEWIRRALRQKKAKLIILAEDASEGTKENYRHMGKTHQVDVIVFGDKDGLGKHIGKTNRSAIAINDEGLKQAILDRLNKE